MKLRNLYLALALIAVGFGSSRAQQVPLYASYTVDPFLLSPSFAGTDEGLRAFALSRLQFVNIPGAPTTFMGTVDAPFSGQHMGVGGSIYTTERGLLRNTGLSLAYSYKVDLNDEFRVHLGIALDAAQQSVDFESVVAQDMSEGVLQVNNPTRFLMNSTFGIHIEYKNFWMGASVPQLFETKVIFQNFQDDTEATFEQKRHYNAFLGYTINIKPDVWDFEPLVVMRSASGVQAQFDVNFRILYRDIAFLTLGYRSDYAMTFGGGVNVTPKFLIGYSYDLPTNEISNFTSGSHEFLIGYLPFKGGSSSGMSRREMNRLIEKKQQEEGERVKALYENQVDDLVERIDNLEEENGRQQQEIDSLKEQMSRYESEIESYRKDLEERNKQLLEDWRASGGSGGSSNSGQPNPRGRGSQGTVGSVRSTQNIGSTEGSDATDLPPGKHIVVEASFHEMDRAIEYQKLLRRNGDSREMRITRSDNGNWYFVHGADNSYDDAGEAFKALNSMSTDNLVPRMKPWVYSRYKVEK